MASRLCFDVYTSLQLVHGHKEEPEGFVLQDIDYGLFFWINYHFLLAN